METAESDGGVVMQQSEIKEIICRYIADSLNCTVGQLEQEGTFFIRNEKEEKGYLKICPYLHLCV